LEPKVTKEGEWAGLYDPASGHTIIHYWSPNKKPGRKWVMGNACQKTSYDHPPAEVPLFEVSGKCYSVCDHYNRSLVDRLWPHKKRGKKRLGTLGAQQNFIPTCILMNTINAWNEIRKKGHEDYDFRLYCLDLADELFINS
jgi:hypothetical protein